MNTLQRQNIRIQLIRNRLCPKHQNFPGTIHARDWSHQGLTSLFPSFFLDMDTGYCSVLKRGYIHNWIKRYWRRESRERRPESSKTVGKLSISASLFTLRVHTVCQCSQQQPTCPNSNMLDTSILSSPTYNTYITSNILSFRTSAAL